MKPIISPNTRIRHPKIFKVSRGVIVDDFCYFSTQVAIGTGSHIASGCSVAGGPKLHFRLGKYCSLSSGVKIWCASNDFVNDIVVITPQGMKPYKDGMITGDVTIDDYCAVGANSVIMPGNHILEGTVIGALSFVPANFKFKPWSVYAGNPIRLLKPRNKKNVLAQAKLLDGFFDRGKKNG
jgi:acetyltransferase-like isoleucine patch superfamily enzyme